MSTSSPFPPASELPAGFYALKVRSRGEATVAKALRDKGHEVLYPSTVERRQYSDRVRKVEAALFPGYLFTHIDTGRLLGVVSTDGVSYLVKHGRAPQPLSSSELKTIHALCQAEEPCESMEGFRVGQRVLIEGGPFAGIEGVLDEVRGPNRVVVAIQSLFRSVSVTTGTSALRLL